MACQNCMKNKDKKEKVRNFETIGVRRSFEDALPETQSRNVESIEAESEALSANPNTKDMLIAILTERGVDFKRTYGVDKLTQLVNDSNPQ